jgi:Reverse transcriptase (RNA-dependent DNA polymerase)
VCPGYRVVVGERVSLLLFADDIVILAISQRDLQAALEVLSKNCKLWRLQVNPKKCKVVLGGKAKLSGPIRYRGEAMEVVKEFVYLEVPIHGAVRRAGNCARVQQINSTGSSEGSWGGC